MKPAERQRTQELTQRLFEAEATIEALFSGQIDAMVDSKSKTPLLLSEAQQALRASEEQYRQIVEATTDGIIKLDTVDRIVFVNRRFAEMLGYQPAEMIGMSVFAFMSIATGAVVADALQARPAGPKDALETSFRHKDGSEVSVDIATSPLLDGEGGQTGNLGVVRDVTERKKLQSQLMVSDRMASVGTLAAGVAHEINNPLAAVIGNLEYVVETLARGRADPGRTGASLSPEAVLDEIRSPLEDAREAAEIVRLIVLDLKIFSCSPIEGARSAVDVEAVMESSLRMARNEIRHRARLVKAYGGVPEVEVNEARLGQVFLNLIVNAAQALPEGRAAYHEIRVTTHLDGERVVIAVSDTGAGIPPEIIGRIFDAFFTTKPVGVGTGLGLAICQRIVTDMGGGLTVASEVGRGTTFSVSLPIARQLQREAVTSISERSSLAAGRRGRILVVDDDELVLSAVQRILSPEHEVVCMVTAKEVLGRCASGETFDLILCDLMMPDVTGMDLFRELSRVAPAQASRMIFLTGGAFTPAARYFLSETPREHIEKPFNPANLRAIIQRRLRST